MAAANALCTVQEFKSWYPLDNTMAEEEKLIESWIDVASAKLEEVCRRVFRQGSITDEPHDGCDDRVIRVRRPPITSVSALKIVDVDGTLLETIPASAYAIPTKATDPDPDVNDRRIVLASTSALGSSVFAPGYRNVLVSYVGGFAAIPAQIKEACFQLTATYMAQRGRDARVIEESQAGGVSYNRRPTNKFGIPSPVYALVARYILTASRVTHGIPLTGYRRRTVSVVEVV
jgi:hypothetical protein